ncbi:hypothetical protein [Actinomadura craniellae]|uniref:hypothetical protein n=1 Tax=Actinomadura craniellae TaxID=2231787 RepID=UPI000DD05BC2|nr:hypothetical protein [Actinomadura craniellae]
MNKLHRLAVTGIVATGLSLGVPGLAMADTVHKGKNQSAGVTGAFSHKTATETGQGLRQAQLGCGCRRCHKHRRCHRGRHFNRGFGRGGGRGFGHKKHFVRERFGREEARGHGRGRDHRPQQVFLQERTGFEEADRDHRDRDHRDRDHHGHGPGTFFGTKAEFAGPWGAWSTGIFSGAD